MWLSQNECEKQNECENGTVYTMSVYFRGSFQLMTNSDIDVDEDNIVELYLRLRQSVLFGAGGQNYVKLRGGADSAPPPLLPSISKTAGPI